MIRKKFQIYIFYGRYVKSKDVRKTFLAWPSISWTDFYRHIVNWDVINYSYWPRFACFLPPNSKRPTRFRPKSSLYTQTTALPHKNYWYIYSTLLCLWYILHVCALHEQINFYYIFPRRVLSVKEDQFMVWCRRVNKGRPWYGNVNSMRLKDGHGGGIINLICIVVMDIML